MQYNITINQAIAIQYNLTLTRAAVLDYIFKAVNWATDLKQLHGQTLFLLSRKKAAADLPLISDKPDTIYRHYKALEKAGLIDYHCEPVYNSNGVFAYMKDYVRVKPEIAEAYYKAPVIEKNQNPTKNRVGNKSEGGRKSVRGGSDENPTYYNINNNYSIKKKDNVALKSNCVEIQKEVIEYLNLRAGRQFKSEGPAGRKNRAKVKSLISRGYTALEIKTMIDFKANEWGDSERWRKYLRPETIFGSKADTYIEASKSLKPSKALDNEQQRKTKSNALRQSEQEYSDSGGIFRPRRTA